MYMVYIFKLTLIGFFFINLSFDVQLLGARIYFLYIFTHRMKHHFIKLFITFV